MYDARKILPLLVVFVGLVTIPLWYSPGKTQPQPDLRLDTPAIRKLADKRCVESTGFMRSSHMNLLERWRNEVVRNGDRVYVSSDGRQFDMSLSGTCFGCHSNKEQFCDRCHTYEGVKPNCWSCHTVPKEKF
jgi:hypothetical protein